MKEFIEYKAKVINSLPLKEGISNSTYLINDKDVMRIAKEPSDPFYESRVEKSIIKLVAPLAISEEVRYFNEATKTKISNYIPKTKRLNKKVKKRELKKFINSLKKLHSLSYKEKQFSPFKRLSYYKVQSGASLGNDELEEAIIKRAKLIYANAESCLCHNDLVKGNILFAKKKAYIIDFEYASNNIALFDLASFLNENEIYKKTKIIKFLRLYLKERFDLIEYKKVRTLMGLNSILWYYWSLYNFNVKKEDVFLEIAKVKKELFLKDTKELF